MTTDRAFTAVFPDGSMVKALNAEDFERQLREDAWNPSDKSEYRQELTRRALNWSRWQLNPKARSETFVRGLEKAGLVTIWYDDQDSTTEQAEETENA